VRRRAAFCARIAALALAGVLFGTSEAPAREGEAFVVHGGPVKDVTVAGGVLATAGFDYSIVLWERESGRVRARLLAHRGPVYAVAADPARDLLVSASDDGALGVWSLKEGALLVRTPGHEGKSVAVALSPSGRFAATAGWDGRVIVWAVPSGEPVVRLEEPLVRFTGVAFVDEERLAAADQAGALRLWRWRERRLQWRSEGNGFPITRLLARGGRLWSGAIDGTIRAWRAADGGELLRLLGQSEPVLSLAASADGGRLASGTAAGTIYVWDAREQRAERVLRAPGGPVWALALDAEGRFLYTGHGDGALRVWDLETGLQIAGPRETYVSATDRVAAAFGAPKLFNTCRLCHSLTPDGENKSGPTFYGLFGRRVGGLEGYSYSEALKAADFVWTEETVAELFTLGPDRYLPGTKMPVQKVNDREELERLVRWLAEVTASLEAGANAQAED